MNKELLFYFLNENWVILAGFFFALIMTFSTFSAAQVESLSPEQAVLFVNKDINIIDLRKPEDFKKGHIKGAVNKNASKLTSEISDWIQKQKNKEVLLYCSMGTKSVNLIKKIKKINKEIQIYNLQGGIAAWKASHYPIEKNKK